MASIEYIVNAVDASSGVFAKIAAAADGLDKQLKDLGDRVAEPEVDLKDTKFTTAMINAAKRLDKLNAMVADPAVKVDTAKAQLEILRINGMLDRLNAKHVTATVKVDVDRSFLSRLGGLFGGGGGGGFLGGIFSLGGAAAGAGGQAAGGASSSSGQVGQAIQGGIIAAAIAAAMALTPALLPTLLGGGVGLGGAVLGGIFGTQGTAAVRADQQALAQARASLAGSKTGGSPTQRLALSRAQAQLARDQAKYGDLIPFGQAVTGAGQSALGVLLDTLTGRPILKRGGTGPGTHGQVLGTSFIADLMPILKQVSGFIKSIGPDLGNLFRASLPFLSVFVKFMEQLAKTLLPVFTTMLKQMTPFLPLISQGLLQIVTGLAGMIKAIGPQGMRDSAKLFIDLCKLMGWALAALGKTANFLAVAIYDTAVWIHKTWDRLRHDTAVIFDGIRHDIAAIWDTIWRNTITRVQNGIADVVNWFKGLPGKITGALSGLGHQLWQYGSFVVGQLWNGLKSIWGSVTSWFSGLPHTILHALGIASPPTWAIDAGKHIMGGILKGLHLGSGSVSNFMGALSTKLGSAFGGGGGGAGFGPGGSVAQWIIAALSATGSPMSWLPALMTLVSRESGGNPHAYNPTSVLGQHAEGLWQMLPSTLASYGGGSPWNPVTEGIAAIRYIRAVYGSPYNIHGLLGGGTYYGYDQGGWLPTGLSLAMNKTGRPERVLGPGEGGSYTINVNVPPTANLAEVGRVTVEAIRQFEKRSGAGWRR